jgi:glucose-6-phosphate-specific signal transduction histidine kinase
MMFQKTPLFKLLLLIGSLGLGVLIQYLYTRRKIRRQKLRNRLRNEEQSKIRLRTAEDFHDEIGNKLTRINVLTNVLRSKINPGDDVGRLLTQIEENTNMLYGGTRDILWSLKPSNDSLFEILMRIKEFGTEL